MTIKITFEHKKTGELRIFLFGNSYKTWDDQYEEFRLYRSYFEDFNNNHVVLRAEQSSSKWKSWGGLKWCEEVLFQEELNREGCQAGDPDNPKPRLYSDFEFRRLSLRNERLLDEIEDRLYEKQKRQSAK